MDKVYNILLEHGYNLEVTEIVFVGGGANVANHSLRLNLDNEQHRRVERVLADLNLDVHKSINQFLVEAVDCYIRKLEGTELTYEDGRIIIENL